MFLSIVYLPNICVLKHKEKSQSFCFLPVKSIGMLLVFWSVLKALEGDKDSSVVHYKSTVLNIIEK